MRNCWSGERHRYEARARGKKKQGMLYTKVLRPDSSERVREPRRKSRWEKGTAGENKRDLLGQGECERGRERATRSPRNSPHRWRDACIRLSIYYGGRGGRRGRRVGVRAKGWKGGTYFIFMGICRYCALAPTACGRELTDLPLFPPSVSSSPPHSFSLSPSLLRHNIFCRASAASLSFSFSDVLRYLLHLRGVLSAGRATGGRTMCHLRCHPIFRSYHDMLKARSTLTLDILYRCARLSHIYI